MVVLKSCEGLLGQQVATVAAHQLGKFSKLSFFLNLVTECMNSAVQSLSVIVTADIIETNCFCDSFLSNIEVKNGNYLL